MNLLRVVGVLSLALLFIQFVACVADESSKNDAIDANEDISIVMDVEIYDALLSDAEDIIIEDILDVGYEDLLDVSDLTQDISLDVEQDIVEDVNSDEDISYEDLSDSPFLDTGDIDMGFEDNTEIPDVGPIEDYDRYVVVSHPFGLDGSTCGRDIEFLLFSKDGLLSRTDMRMDIGDCPVKVRFSPDGKFLFVILNNNHNPQAGTQSVVVLKKDLQGRFQVLKEFAEFSGENPEYIVFKRDGSKAFVVDFNIEGEGGIHIIKRENEDWIYEKEVMLALPKAMVILPDDRYAIIVGGKDPEDMAIMDIEREEIVAKSDIFSDFVDSLGLDVTSDGRYLVVPNSSPYSEIGNTLSIVEVDYSTDIPSLVLKQIVSNINEPSASLFTSDNKYLVVTNFSKNYTTLFYH
ncbi:MAG: hypothetical protein ACP5KG_12945, partial [Myxococcota bacterium]